MLQLRNELLAVTSMSTSTRWWDAIFILHVSSKSLVAWSPITIAYAGTEMQVYGGTRPLERLGPH